MDEKKSSVELATSKQDPKESGSQRARCYITGISVELHPRDEQSASLLLQHLHVRGGFDGLTLLALQSSSPTTWFHDGLLEMPLDISEVTFVIGSKDAGDIGRLSFVQGDLLQLANNEYKHARVMVLFTRKFATGEDGPRLSLSFSMSNLPPDNPSETAAPMSNVMLIAQAYAALNARSPDLLLSLLRHLSDDKSHKPQLLHSCGKLFFNRFQTSRATADIDKAISAYSSGYALSSQVFANDDPILAARLTDLAFALWERTSGTKVLSDVDETIEVVREVLVRTPAGHVRLVGCHQVLGLAFQTRFDIARNIDDLSSSIAARREVVGLLPALHPALPANLIHLGVALRTRFIHTGDLADINDAIESKKQALRLFGQKNPGPSAWFNNLGYSLRLRFEKTRNMEDISASVSSQENAVELTPDTDGQNLSLRLDNLATSLLSRFSQSRDSRDVDRAIAALEMSVNLLPDDHPDLSSRLNNLGSAFSASFESSGSLKDIDQAIAMQRKGLLLLSKGHHEFPLQISHLSLSLRTRFQHTGSLVDLSEAISLQEQVITLSPDDAVILPAQLTDLAQALRYRFENSSDQTDIADAISALRRALQVASPNNPTFPQLLDVLGVSLHVRFSHNGDPVDLSEAIRVGKQAKSLLPEVDHRFGGVLSNLGVFLESQYRLTRDNIHLEQAITTLRKSIQLTPEGHNQLPARLNNLANFLQLRFEEEKRLDDITEAISTQQRAIDITPADHPELRTWLGNLGIRLHSRFEQSGHVDDIDLAIAVQEKAVRLAPDGHAHVPAQILTLGMSYQVRYNENHRREDIMTAIKRYRDAATSNVGSPITRLAAAQHWATFSQQYDRPQVLEAYGAAVELLSVVAGMGQTIETRHSHLINMSKISSDAAATAFELGRYDLSLEWLEQGRCLVWNQLNQLRTPLDDLRAHDPNIADRLLVISRSLEIAGSRRVSSSYSSANPTYRSQGGLIDEGSAHLKLTTEWNQLLENVRLMPGFHDFLRPRKARDFLAGLPTDSTVVMISAHKHGCDALALIYGREDIVPIPLQDMTHSEAERLRNLLGAYLQSHGVRSREAKRGVKRARVKVDIGIIEILRILWEGVVKPIFDVLGYKEPPDPSNPNRIFWCPTGPLAFLPIHGAGIYPQGYIASDFAFSSYIPTVTSLLEKIKHQQARGFDKPTVNRMLLVSQPNTPGLPPIPKTVEETAKVARILSAKGVDVERLNGAAAAVDRVKEEMSSSGWIHFACHANQEIGDPLRSSFHLHDGRLELSTIMKLRLQIADLAFLSACQTSTGDEKLSEEAVHLAAGMLAAGYRNVVATMWSIDDDYGPKIAETFYDCLLIQPSSTGVDSANTALALHHAMRIVREKIENLEVGLLTTIPYIHFGI